MRTDKESIYRREFDRLLDSGFAEYEASRLARARADEIYWELVDRGRQEAKDR